VPEVLRALIKVIGETRIKTDPLRTSEPAWQP
jgi:hypothetical protein